MNQKEKITTHVRITEQRFKSNDLDSVIVRHKQPQYVTTKLTVMKWLSSKNYALWIRLKQKNVKNIMISLKIHSIDIV